MENELDFSVLENKKPSVYMPKFEQKYDFNSGFKHCCNVLKKKTREDSDAVIGITGPEGVSKSTLANHIGFHTDKHYTLEKNCLFSPDEESMVKAITNLPRFSAVNADEAIKILYKQQWWVQVFINKFYRLCRQDNKISILCMPRFAEFNEGFRNHRILIWIHLLDRGIGVVFMKDWNPFTPDPWNTKKNWKSITSYGKKQKYFHLSLEKKLSILEKSPNFVDVITFPDLEPELRLKYKTLAAAQKYKGMDMEKKQNKQQAETRKRYDRNLTKMRNLIKDELGLTDQDIARRIGERYHTIRSHFVKDLDKKP